MSRGGAKPRIPGIIIKANRSFSKEPWLTRYIEDTVTGYTRLRGWDSLDPSERKRKQQRLRDRLLFAHIGATDRGRNWAITNPEEAQRLHEEKCRREAEAACATLDAFEREWDEPTGEPVDTDCSDPTATAPADDTNRPRDPASN